jgi:gliding motility-associated-like protein
MNRVCIFLSGLVILSSSFDLLGQPKYPLRFLENKGQVHSDVLYYADIPGGKIYLKKDQLLFLFVDYGNLVKEHQEHDKIIPDSNPNAREIGRSDTIKGHSYRVFFENASDDVDVVSSDAGKEKYNYFVGSDPSGWASGVSSFGAITYRQIYEGIDLVIYSNQAGLKYDFILSPKADPEDIRMVYDGLDKIYMENGSLHMKTSLSSLVEKNPVAFQDETLVDCQFRLENKTVTFAFPEEYDRTRKLTIDPLLIFSTYSGSAADNWGNTATFDNQGNLYSGGMTNHTRFLSQEIGTVDLGEFIVTPDAYQTEYGGIWDVALLKYDSSGSELLFGTYLGGSNSEVPQSIVVNNKGELVILGITSSDDFPISENAYKFNLFGSTGGGVQYSEGSDIFITKLSGDGTTLISSTYFGGTGNDGMIESTLFAPNLLVRNYGDHSRGDVIVDSEDNIYIASRTSSTDLVFEGFQPEHGGGNVDGIVLKMSDDLSTMIWGTYYGGSGEDATLSIKLTPQNDIYVAGGTTSIDFPTTPDVIHPGPTGATNVDGFVAKISSDGSTLEASSYIGTTNYDQVYQMDLDTDGDVYVVGQTRGGLYPVTKGIDSLSGQFVHKLTPELDSTLFATVFGSQRGEPDIYITAFLVNDCDNLYISGWGSPNLVDRGVDFMRLRTSGLITTPEAHQLTSDGSSFYLAVYTDDMSELLYATHLGTGSSLVHVDGGTSRFDKQGIVYHAVCASCNVDDSTFPTTPGAWAEQNGSRGCNNAAFKFDLASLNARIRTNTADFSQPNIRNGCAPFEVAFENISVGGEIFEWDFGDEFDTVSFVRDTIFHTFESSGTYEIRLRALDSSTCAEEDFAFTTINVYSTDFQVSESTEICGGSFAQLSASGGAEYFWEPRETLIQPNSPYPKARPDTTTMYYLTMIDQNGCRYQDSLTVEVIPEIKIGIDVALTDKCSGVAKLDFTNSSENFDSISWNFGNGDTSSELEPLASYLDPGDYDVVVTLTNQGCVKEFTIPVLLDELFIPNVLTPNGDGENDVFKITTSLPIKLSIFNRNGKEEFQSDDYQNDWDGKGMNPGVYYYEVTFPDLEICSGWVHLLF